MKEKREGEELVQSKGQDKTIKQLKWINQWTAREKGVKIAIKYTGLQNPGLIDKVEKGTVCFLAVISCTEGLRTAVFNAIGLR